MIMIPVMVIIMMMIIIIISIVVILMIIIIIIIIIIIVIIVKAKLKLFSDVVQADYPRVLISKFISVFSVFVSATLPSNLGSTDNQHHFSDANYKVTLTLKFYNTMKLTIVLLVGPKALFYLGPERLEAIWRS